MPRFDIGDLVSPAVNLCCDKRTAEMKFTLNMMTKVREEGAPVYSFYPAERWEPFCKSFNVSNGLVLFY